jgi:hypothetical protein
MMSASALLLLFAAAMPPGDAGEPAALANAAALADAVRQARVSDGFEFRMNVLTIRPDGRRAPLKLAVIGQFAAGKERLLIRGLAPDSVRDHYIAAERSADGAIRSIVYDGPAVAGISQGDASGTLFGSELVLWDMFAPWWHWPNQELGEARHAAGRDCLVVLSRPDAGFSTIRTVESCVDANAKVSLRTELFDGRHKRVRTIAVERLTPKASKGMAITRMSVTGSDHSTSEVDVYSGDEGYVITADTFSALDSHPAAKQ